MFEETAQLRKIHVKNFLSFVDTELSLKPLTVIVGPNASGKSNVLEALHFLNLLTASENLPEILAIPDSSEGHPIRDSFQFAFRVKQTLAVYNLTLEAKAENPSDNEKSSIRGQEFIPMRIVGEELLVNDVKVISTLGEHFMLKDENGENETSYKPNSLALKAAGDYGNKPVTSALTEFHKGMGVSWL